MKSSIGKDILAFKVLAILLICLILSLSILDAPEYVRCTNVGMCEFLDLHAHQANILKLNTIMRFYNTAKNNYSSILENLIISKESIQSFVTLCIPAIIESFKFLFPLKKTRNKFFIKKEQTFHLAENDLTVQTIDIVKISVIRS